MPRRAKFKPQITRVKLNPEQAVLSCNCFTSGYKLGRSATVVYYVICEVAGNAKFIGAMCRWEDDKGLGATAS